MLIRGLAKEYFKKLLFNEKSEVSLMEILSNARYEKFVQCLLQGMSQRKAYREAFPQSTKWKDNTVDVKASQLFSNDKVLIRYKELQEESKDAAIMKRKDRMIVLSEIASDECGKPDARIKAIDTLNKMDGQYVNKVEVSGALVTEKTKLDDLIKQMRDGDG